MYNVLLKADYLQRTIDPLMIICALYSACKATDFCNAEIILGVPNRPAVRYRDVLVTVHL